MTRSGPGPEASAPGPQEPQALQPEPPKGPQSPRGMLERLGFRLGSSGPHAARTFMLKDLTQLLAHTEASAPRDRLRSAIVDENVLGKPTRKARELAFRHLATLYGLDPTNPIYRALRRLWARNEAAQPMLALGVALARDPLLRASQAFTLELKPGHAVSQADYEAHLHQRFAERLSAASRSSIARNLRGTWTAAGFLTAGKSRERCQPPGHPESMALLLFLGHLEGLPGPHLLRSSWARLLGGTLLEREALAIRAAQASLLDFLSSGGVQEVRFPGYLDSEEAWLRQEVVRVV